MHGHTNVKFQKHFSSEITLKNVDANKETNKYKDTHMRVTRTRTHTHRYTDI